MGSFRTIKTLAERIVVVFFGTTDAGESSSIEKGAIKIGSSNIVDSHQENI